METQSAIRPANRTSNRPTVRSTCNVSDVEPEKQFYAAQSENNKNCFDRESVTLETSELISKWYFMQIFFTQSDHTLINAILSNWIDSLISSQWTKYCDSYG